VVGAGIVGLSTAHFLNSAGASVTVYEGSDDTRATASYGNAGWVIPGMVAPLPSPEVLRYGFRALVDPRSPVKIGSFSPALARFLVGFARHSTAASSRRGRSAMGKLAEGASDAFAAIVSEVEGAVVTRSDSFLAMFADERARDEFEHELAVLGESGPALSAQRHEIEDRPGDGVRGHPFGLRMAIDSIDPARFLGALDAALRSRSVVFRRPAEVVAVHADGERVRVQLANGEVGIHDDVVLATGAVIGKLGRRLGMRTAVQAGRGYSFACPRPTTIEGPVYFPVERLAITPLDSERVRVAGMMEFASPAAPLRQRQRQLQRLVDEARRVHADLDVERRTDEWVGSRPCTADGLPVIGPTLSPHVHIAGGHGMWGVTLGPVTGRLLADSILTGRVADVVKPFDPLRE
jgi:D-amino-acid dehydrogenase